MATLSINQAAKTFKRGRNTIQAMLKSGELSRAADGQGIEFSELMRVFGEPPSQPGEQPQAMPESLANTRESNLKPNSEQAAERAQAIELAVLKERVAGLENLLAEREKLVLLLSHKTEEAATKLTPEQPAKPAKKTIWQKLFY